MRVIDGGLPRKLLWCITKLLALLVKENAF
jgi:hypothetical protein